MYIHNWCLLDLANGSSQLDIYMCIISSPICTSFQVQYIYMYYFLESIAKLYVKFSNWNEVQFLSYEKFIYFICICLIQLVEILVTYWGIISFGVFHWSCIHKSACEFWNKIILLVFSIVGIWVFGLFFFHWYSRDFWQLNYWG